MSRNNSLKWVRATFAALIFCFLFLAISSQSAYAAPQLQEDIRIANDQVQLWFAVIAMASLVLLGLVWVLWPERRRFKADGRS